MANIRAYNIGNIYPTNEGYFVEITSIIKCGLLEVKFTDNEHKAIVTKGNLKRGSIANPLHLSICGVACFGIGEYKAWVDEKHTEVYKCWKSMIYRVYKNTINKNKTYKNVAICDIWLNFQNFARWYNENYTNIDGVKLHLDKDLLQENIENKIYSPDTCVFLPHNVNAFLSNKQSNNTSGFIGVSWYKATKKWRAYINLFGEGKIKNLGCFDTPEEASEAYKKARGIESEKVKCYLRSLNYLPEEIIDLIK